MDTVRIVVILHTLRIVRTAVIARTIQAGKQNWAGDNDFMPLLFFLKQM